MRVALLQFMAAAKKFEDLDAWQLASQLEDEVFRMTSTGGANRDFEFRDQIRASASSAPSNIAEGFGRYYPNENAPYVRTAKASLHETQNHLLSGKRKRYFSADDFEKAWLLAKRALGAATRYLQYLERCGRNVPGQPPRDGKIRTRNREPGTKNHEPGTGNQEPGTG